MQGCSAKLAGEPRLDSSCIYFFFRERGEGKGGRARKYGGHSWYIFSLDEVEWAECAQNSALHRCRGVHTNEMPEIAAFHFGNILSEQ